MDKTVFEDGLSFNEQGRPIFLGTPFLECTAKLNENALWLRWGNYMVVDTYSDQESELRAIRTNVAMGDMSPLAKYKVSGKEAVKYLDYMMPRSIKKMTNNQVYFSPWCNNEGLTVGDGLVVCENETSFFISSDPGLNWWTSNAIGFDVTISDETDNYGILTLQGPKSKETIEDATNGQVKDLPFSRCQRLTFDDHEVLIMRQGFTGEHGYEIWTPREIGPKIWKLIESAGKKFGITPVGSWALDISRVEAGLIIPGYDYTGAGPKEEMAGAAIYASSEFAASPYELNLGHFIDFSSEKFIGYDALYKNSDTKNLKKLVGLELDWQNLPNTEPKEFKRVRWYPVSAYQNDTEIGYVTSIVWSPTLKKVIGFGHLNNECFDTTQKIDLLWENNEKISASLCPFPFYKVKRAD